MRKILCLIGLHRWDERSYTGDLFHGQQTEKPYTHSWMQCDRCGEVKAKVEWVVYSKARTEAVK